MSTRGVGGLAAIVIIAGCSRTSASKADAGQSTAELIAQSNADIASAQAMLSAMVPVETPVAHMDKLDYAGALAYAKPKMEDTANNVSDGAAMFAIWSAKHLRWTDVSVAKDETSYALVRKDSDSERGKRLCTSGQIIQIKVEKLDNGSKLAEGILMSNGGNLYSYEAAGSSGELVGESYARLCGVVTGNYDYSNSAGGTGHAVQIIGMFDLAENKPKKQ